MYDVPAVVALRDYLGVFVATHPLMAKSAYQEELRQRVRAVVDELKAADWPPERVIVAVKQVANDAGLSPTRHILSATAVLTESDAAIVHMVRWCIERYYDIETPTS